MSNYPVWWDKTITIYNKFVNPITQAISWYHHTIDGCFWKDVGQKVQIGDVTLESNDIVCRIPKSGAYVPAYQWEALDDKSQVFTLSQGDIIIPAEVDDEINEYASGRRSADLIKKYKAGVGCLTVERMTEDNGPGRCCEHYHVRGL